MTILGIRFCTVAPSGEVKALAELFETDFGFAKTDFGMETEGFAGAVFPAGEHSWIEMWAEGEGMPAGIMLHIVVDDADAYAAKAKESGAEIQGPMDAHGERLYFCKAPTGLQIAVLSRTAE
ncbi:hypothetical protein [Aquisalinus flavus]|uniref:VOC domain-containing protein n=1 Tax=Aquisalinus flavus TaxID=1526572 RepID=A0A8J2Y7J2_9PROT|nr:hypothetical protein [Aquisalinus flavus]MBD0427608.1 hypothetical protein [Aquisalinus flavus]UNE47396.1 hypothetical protein FF099_04635 [Aquisalinus flavus]GGD02348.1 hypothetical protein GCM10011342_09220 [Aquisalinus flavus]